MKFNYTIVVFAKDILLIYKLIYKYNYDLINIQ